MMDQPNNLEELLELIKTDRMESLQETLLSKLAFFINDLLQHDFTQLLTLLYRVDVDEGKLKKLLKYQPA